MTTPIYRRHVHPQAVLEVRQLQETEQQINALWKRVEAVVSGGVAINLQAQGYSAYGFVPGTGGAFGVQPHKHSADDITSGLLRLSFGGTFANLSDSGPGYVQQSATGGAFVVKSADALAQDILEYIREGEPDPEGEHDYCDAPFDLSHLVRQCSGNATSDYTHYRLTDLLEPSVHIYNPFDSDFQDPPVAPEERLLVWTTCGATPATDGMVPIFWEDGYVQVIEKGFIFSSQTQTILNQGLGTSILFYSGVAASGEFTGYHQETFTQADWYIYAAEGLALNSICLGYTRTGLPAVNLVGLRLPNVAAGYSTMDLMPSGGGVRVGSAVATAETFTVGGRIALLEGTAPALTANYGKIYPLAADHHLYYMDASGNAGQIWTSYNDGTGSGLDADLVDGVHGPFMAEPSGTLNYHAKFTGSGTTIGNSILSDDGTTVSGTGRLSLTDDDTSITIGSFVATGDSAVALLGSASGYASIGVKAYTSDLGQPFRAEQGGTLTDVNDQVLAILARTGTVGGQDYSEPMLVVTDATAATGTFAEFSKYSASEASTHLLIRLYHDDDGLTCGFKLYGYAKGLWSEWDLHTGEGDNLLLTYNNGASPLVEFNGVADTVYINGVPQLAEIAALSSGVSGRLQLWADSTDHLLHYLTAAGAAHKIWTDANDGTGSGLDADTVDGLHAADIVAGGHNHGTGTDNYVVKFNAGASGTIKDSAIKETSGLVEWDGWLALKHQAVPADKSGYGQLWVYSGNSYPYFTLTDGNDYTLALGNGNQYYLAIWSSTGPFLGNSGITDDGTTVTFDRDLEMASDNAVYLGDAATDGTYKIVRDGNDLIFSRRESGVYVEKHRVEAA